MSAKNPHSPACILAGEITPLAISLSQQLKKISCDSYFLPTKISVTNTKIDSQNTVSIEQLKTGKISNIKYIFYFAPESILESQSKYKERFLLISQLLEYGNLIKSKTILITRDPKEYITINQSNNIFKQNHHQIATHTQQLTLLLNSFNGGAGFKIRIVLKDLVGGEIIRNSPLTINNLFLDIPIKIYTTKRDSHILHPLDYNSAAKQIIKTTFSQNYLEIPYEIIGSNQITLINAALFLKTKLEHKNNSQTQIISTDNNDNYQEITTQKILINSKKDPTTLLEESMNWCINNPHKKKAFQSKLPKAPIYRQVTKSNQTEDKNGKKRIVKPKNQTKTKKNNLKIKNKLSKSIILVTIIAIFLSLSVPPLLFSHHLKKAQTSLKLENYLQSIQHIKKANTFFTFSKPALKAATLYSKLIIPKKYDDIKKWTNIIKEIGLVANKSEKLLVNGGEVVNQIVANQKGDVFLKIEDIAINLETIYNQLSSVQANLNSINEFNYNPKQSETIIDFKDQLSSSRKNLMDVIKLLNNSSEILGKDSSKTYLTLLQNNSELRPTGGFIGSFALITFESGKLLDIETFDVYSADGQLRGHVEPPVAIKKYLGEASWYLRDSNWDPDFPVSARRAEWFLDKELNRQVDGTIGINLYVIKDLLKATGEIEITDYQETISADNLFHRAEYFSELNYFDGSTQKKDFLSSLINAIHFKISSLEENIGLKALMSLVNSANQSQLQISLRDKIVEESLSDTIFSGATKIKDAPITETPSISDYLSIIESNVGVNKVNYFVDRSIDHKIIIDDNTINSQTKVTLTNKAETAAWPAGTYKNFIRFILPQNASIKKVLVDGNSVKAADLEIITDNFKKSLGFLVEVPINSQKIISVDYTPNQTIPQKSSYEYDFLFEKQSGTQNDPINIEIISNQKDTPTKTNLGSIDNNTVKVSTTNDFDRHIVVNFAR